jgi:hypothetical protein
MKTRYGFVSNSSSTSFIIKDKSEENVRRYITSLLDARNQINNENRRVDDICTIHTTNDVNIYIFNYYDYYHYGNKITFDQYKKLENITKEEQGVIVESTSDNSIPLFIKEALEEIGKKIS